MESIEKIEVPSWLFSKDYVFNIKDILKDSLYYPCSGFDGEPVRYFRGNVHSFVYVDYNKSRADLIHELEVNGFRDFRVVRQESILEKQLTPHGWNAKFLPMPSEYVVPQHIKPYCEWVIFENSVGERFSLLQQCAEAVATYNALYLSNGLSPRIIMIDRAGPGFGLNWTNLYDENGYFARTVLSNEKNRPLYLATDRGTWSSYPKHIEEMNFALGLWGMEDNR